MATTIQHAKPTQHAEPITEENLYTILGFQGREDFENKINKFVNKEIWQLFVQCFEKEIGYAANKEVVKNIVCAIAKSHRGNAFTKTERIILNEKQGSKKREKAIGKAIDILKEMYSTKALEELSIIKRQAEGFLKTDFYQAQNKQLQGFAPSGAQLFADTLEYIQKLEKSAESEKKELIEIFLLDRSNVLNKKRPELQVKREDAIRILSSDELREIYNKGIEEGTLQPLASYQACETSLKKLEKQHPEEKSEVNPYAILGFKGREDFENQVNEFTKKEIWSLVIGNFEKAVDLPELKVVMEIVISKIARSCNDNEFLKIDPISLYGKEDITGKRKKEITKVLDILKKIDPEQALNELSIIKKQAEDSLEIYQADLAKFNNQPYTNLSSRDKEAGLETLRQKELCMKTIEYVKSLETLVVKKATRGELVTNFLLNHIKSLNNKLPNSQSQIEDAMKILVNDELVKERDQSVETENLPSLESYEECKAKIDKMEVEEKALEKKELVVNDKGTFPELPACVNKPALLPKPSKKKIEEARQKLAQIKNPDLLKRANKPALLPKPSKEKIEEALKNLAQIKNPDPLKRDNKPVLLPKPSKEKIEEAHKKSAQIENQENKTRELNKDLKRIDRLIKFCVSLSQNPSHKQGASKDTAFSTAMTVFSKAINYHFSSTTKETKNLPDMKKFHGIMDNLHKEHDPQQINKEIGLALTCLANTQNEIYAQLGKFSDTPTTELKDPLQQANSVTKVTRL